MGRSPSPFEEGLNRGAWTAQEDKLLFSYIMAHGEGKWTHVPKRSGLNRSGKSCRLRWLNYLKPDIKRGNITQDEEELIIRLHKLLGNRWSLIAGRLPGRTDNEIKNYWNTTLAKKLRSQSYSMCEQHSCNKSTPSRPEVTRPQVTKIKAARCRSQIVFDTSQPQCSHSSKAQVEEEEEEDQFRGDENMLSCRNNEFELNAADFCGDDVVCNLESSMGMNVHRHADQSLCFGELTVNCCSTASGFDVNDNSTMDLDSIVLFLEYGDWA